MTVEKHSVLADASAREQSDQVVDGYDWAALAEMRSVVDSVAYALAMKAARDRFRYWEYVIFEEDPDPDHAVRAVIALERVMLGNDAYGEMTDSLSDWASS